MSANTWEEIKRGHPNAGDPGRADAVAAQTAEALNEIHAFNLGELRRIYKFTQAELAERMEIDQSQVSRIEHEGDMLISTLGSYIDALGGTISIVAGFRDAEEHHSVLVPMGSYSAGVIDVIPAGEPSWKVVKRAAARIDRSSAKGSRRSSRRLTKRKKQSTMGKNTRHVVRNPKGGWDVKAPKAARSSGNYKTQAKAEARAKEIVSNLGGGEVRIHGRDGKIRDSDTVKPGSDPNPPKDRKH